MQPRDAVDTTRSMQFQVVSLLYTGTAVRDTHFRWSLCLGILVPRNVAHKGGGCGHVGVVRVASAYREVPLGIAGPRGVTQTRYNIALSLRRWRKRATDPSNFRGSMARSITPEKLLKYEKLTRARKPTLPTTVRHDTSPSERGP